MIIEIPKDVLTLIVNNVPFHQQSHIRKVNKLFNSLNVTNIDYDVPIAPNEIANFMMSQFGKIDDKFKLCIEHHYFILYLKSNKGGPIRFYINLSNNTLNYLTTRTTTPIDICDFPSLKSILQNHQIIEYNYPCGNWTVIKHIYSLRQSCTQYEINPLGFYLHQFKQYHLNMLIHCYANIFVSIKQFSHAFQINVRKEINTFLNNQNLKEILFRDPDNYYLDIVHDNHLLTKIDQIRKKFIRKAKLSDLEN